MGTTARKQPFSDLSDTDLDEYERHVRAMRTLADVLREAERFTKSSEHEMNDKRPNAGSRPPQIADSP
jgi:hypothetical protein